MEAQFILNIEKNSFGIPCDWIDRAFHASVPSNAVYKGTKVYLLMQYNAEEDISEFEDERIVLYEPGLAVANTLVFLNIVPQKRTSIGAYDCYTGWHPLNVVDDIGSLCIQLIDRETQRKFQGRIITRRGLTQLTAAELNCGADSLQFFALQGFICVDILTDDIVSAVFARLGTMSNEHLAMTLVMISILEP